VNRGEHVSTDGWAQPVAVLLIDGACRRLPEPERTERAREWIAEVHAILDDPGLGRCRRSVRALRFAAGQYRTVDRAAPRSAAVSRLDRSYSDGDLVVVALGGILAAAVFGGGIGYVTRTHSLAVDAAVLLGTTLLNLALLVATALIAVRRSSRRAGSRRR
jgi:hypothetical protein